MTRLSDLATIERALLIVRRQLAAERRSGSPSRVESGALVQGDQCPESERTEFMDPTNTETDGASSSYERMASELLHRTRQKPRRQVLPLRPAVKRKAGR